MPSSAVGENSYEIRARAVDGLRFLGLEIDEALNRCASGDGELSPPEARASTLLVRAREDLEIARQVRIALGGTA